MKVLHIVGGGLSGGAGKGAYNLHKALIDSGVQSKVLVSQDEKVFDSSIIYLENDYLKRNFRKSYAQLPLRLYQDRTGFFSTGLIGYDITQLDVYKECDIIHLHWINNGFFGIKLLSKINKPIIWTFRDMWPMTGGCHYFGECNNYQNGCGLCPVLSSNNPFDLSKYIWEQKRINYRDNIQPVAISNWVKECAAKSPLFCRTNIKMIPNCIDTNIFTPMDKSLAKEKLGLPKDKDIILFGAINSVNDVRKGFSHLLEALKYLEDKNRYYLLVFGASHSEAVLKLGLESRFLGNIKDDRLLAQVYSASDVFVAPSLEEAFGKTLAESLSCGTPVVAYDSTGPKDIVDHKKCGYSAKSNEPVDLHNGIQWLLQNEDKSTLNRRSREKAVLNYSLSSVSQQYIETYQSAMNISKKRYYLSDIKYINSDILNWLSQNETQIKTTILSKRHQIQFFNPEVATIISKIERAKSKILNNFSGKSDFILGWLYFCLENEFETAFRIIILGYNRLNDENLLKLEKPTFKWLTEYFYKTQNIIFCYDHIRLQQLHEYLKLNNKMCAIFGAGVFGERVLQLLNCNQISVKYFIDNDCKKKGQKKNGIQIIGPEMIDKSLFIVVASNWSQEISKQLEVLGLNGVEDFLIISE